MSVYLTPILKVAESGIYATAEAFSSLSPWVKVAATVVSVAIPALVLCWRASANTQKTDIHASPVAIPERPVAIQEREIVPIKIHTWNVWGKQVNLIRSGDELACEVIHPDGRITRDPIPLPQDRPIENCIENLKKLTPDIQINGKVIFKYQHPCGFDNSKTVDLNMWAITLINSDRGSIKGNLHGHAVILIEGMKEGKYFIQRAHLVEGPAVLLENTLRDRIFHNGKSETWLRSSLLIERMLVQIRAEAADPSRVKFALLASDTDRATSSADNCITWASKKLEMIHIRLPQSAIPWLPKMPTENVEKPNFVPYAVDRIWRLLQSVTGMIHKVYPTPETGNLLKTLTAENRFITVSRLQRFTDGADKCMETMASWKQGRENEH